MKIGYYNPNLPGIDLYDAYESITLGERCPGIDKIKTWEKLHEYYIPVFFHQFDFIVCSPSLRGIQTANLVCEYAQQTKSIVVDDRLHEIYFSLHTLVDREIFAQKKSIAVRRNFISDLCNNSLLEKHNSILQRRKIFDEYPDRTLFISHSFFMKCEYIISHATGDPKDIIQNKNIFTSAISLDKKTFDFCAGFQIH